MNTSGVTCWTAKRWAETGVMSSFGPVTAFLRLTALAFGSSMTPMQRLQLGSVGSSGPEPQLLYALLAKHTGRGYATEMARSLVVYAAKNTSVSVLVSTVDEPNAESSRVLEKVGFESSGSDPGAFGRILQYRYSLGPTMT